MAGLNCSRIGLGALAGGAVWVVWDLIVHMKIIGPRYMEAQQAGHLLAEPRYGAFLPVWIVTLLALAYVAATLYAMARTTCGAGPKTALKIGMMLGFAAGFPQNLSMATWGTFDRFFPLWWMLDLWVGAVLATLVAGWLYRDKAV